MSLSKWIKKLILFFLSQRNDYNGTKPKKRTQNKRQSINHAILIVHEKWDCNERFRRPHVWNQHKSNHSWESHSQSQELVVHFQQKELVVVHIEIVIVALWKLREAWRAKRVNLSILCTTTFNTLLALQPSKTLKFCFLYVPFVIHFQRVLTVAFLSQRLSLSLSLSLIKLRLIPACHTQVCFSILISHPF